MKNYEEYRYSSSSSTSHPIMKSTSYTTSQQVGHPLGMTQAYSTQYSPSQQQNLTITESVKRSSSQKMVGIGGLSSGSGLGGTNTYTTSYQQVSGTPQIQTSEIEYRKSIAEGFRSEKYEKKT